MTLAGLAARNLLRNKFRSALTILGVALAVLAFLLLRTMLSAWTAGVQYAAKDRLVTRHKVTFILPLPVHYAEEIRRMPGIQQATFASWFGGRDPRHERVFFSNIAVDAGTFFEVYSDLVVAPEDMARWREDRRGAIVGDLLARKLGWKVGDRVTLTNSVYPGDWQFTIDGIYTAGSRAVDRSTFYFHWSYFNESVPASDRDTLGWVVSRVGDPGRSAELSQVIDRLFDARDVQTVSQSERAFNVSFLGMISSMLTALDFVSLVILGIMTLVLGNTIAMGVRERLAEYGVLQAIGFRPGQMATLVIAEAMVTGLCGGLLGLAVAYPFIEGGLGRWLEENQGKFFPVFRIEPGTAAVGFLLALVLGLVAALPPAYRVFRVQAIAALRRID